MINPSDQQRDDCRLRTCSNCGGLFTDGHEFFCPACIDNNGEFTRAMLQAERGAERAGQIDRAITRVCLIVAVVGLVYVIAASVSQC